MKVFGALYDLMLRTQYNRTRAVALAALGLAGIVIAFALGASDEPTRLDRIQFLDAYGLALVLPVTSLVFASAALGDLIDDQTMVYLALRPVARWKIALAAMLASLSIVVPLVALPLVAAGFAARLDATTTSGLALASVVGAAAYVGAFTTAGIWLRRALIIGLVYIFVWEQFVARASRGVRRWTISAYTRSVFGHIADATLRDADMSLVWSIVIPLAIAVAMLAYTTRRLHTQDVA